MAEKIRKLKRAVSAPRMLIEKVHASKAFQSIDSFMYKSWRRVPAFAAASFGLNIAGGIGAAGTMLGRGETFMQKVGDAVTAIPKGIGNTINHYFHAPEYLKNANEALGYMREKGPEIASELGRSGRYLETGMRQAQRAINDLEAARDYITPGGDLPFDPQNTFYSLRDGMNQLETAIISLHTGRTQAEETAGPAIEALQNVDLNPVLQAIYNLADNMAPDEVGQTLGIAAASILAGYTASQYVGGFLGRRGRPGIFSRFVQRKGIKKFRDYYTKHPEKIAGLEAIDVFEKHLIENPGKLERLARNAGYEISSKDLKVGEGRK